MRKLITASFSRLWKEKILWFVFLIMSIGSVCYNWIGYNEATKAQIFVEDMIFCMLPMSSFVFALFISMRLGTEFEEHTIRNKFIVGYSRTQVYFAEYITCMVASMILLGIMLLVSTSFGLLLSLEFQSSWHELVLLIFCCVLIASVFSAMFTAISMNVGSKAASLVVSIVFLFAILLVASFCINALAEEPMTYSNIVITAEDGVQFGDLIENSAYIDGTQRTIYELIADILPTGQTIQLNNLEFERAARWPVFSLIMLIIATVAGYLPFRKRDIR
ncbi:ABC transporter permease subunit [Clostridioides difficile]|nr:ABC transporter permease subunit [Clostridioides difficile]MDI6389516.1 ABC transporter permease subunit [Clostridioides difficile]